MLNAIDVDRVRANTARDVNEEIDSRIDESIQLYRVKGVTDILQRLYELEREWDIERMLEMMASSFSLTGLVLGRTKNKRWFIFPTIVLSFLLVHAVQGWCPPLSILRRLGFRTREEIDRELYALKAVLVEGRSN
ncbi:MAG TPA: hypothetical protein VF977_06595 [Candidatus Binatia bacterium]